MPRTARTASWHNRMRMRNRLFGAFYLLSRVAAAGAAAHEPVVRLKPDATAASVQSQAPIDRWILDGSGTWISSSGLLILQKPGAPSGAIRRPAALAILDTAPVERASFQLELRCTAPIDVVHRDLEVIFGYESPTRFYYAHLSGITDAVHNGVFLVYDADRRRIDAGTTPPVLRDQAWHRVRLEWTGATGRIQIYVDDSAAPAFDLTDATIRAGRVGVGSFDDTGEFRRITLETPDLKVRGSE